MQQESLDVIPAKQVTKVINEQENKISWWHGSVSHAGWQEWMSEIVPWHQHSRRKEILEICSLTFTCMTKYMWMNLCSYTHINTQAH